MTEYPKTPLEFIHDRSIFDSKVGKPYISVSNVIKMLRFYYGDTGEGTINLNVERYDTYNIANKMIDKAYEAAILHNKDINVEVDVDGTANSITLNFYIHEGGDK